MKKLIYLCMMVPLLFCGCDKDDDVVKEEEEQDQFYIKYTANYCDFDDHFVQYRDENGNLVRQKIHTSEEQVYEIGPVSPKFQAYIEGTLCTHTPVSIHIYVRKNNQAYIEVAKQSMHVSSWYSGYRSCTYNVFDYD